MNDLKVSHRNTYIVTCMAHWLQKTYQCIFSDRLGTMKVSHGKVHDYLGKKLDFTKPGAVKVTMILYLREILTEFSKFDDSAKTANSPAANHLSKSMTLPNILMMQKQLSSIA